jgi:glycosyltransferase involved in cell wall biosynthesis
VSVGMPAYNAEKFIQASIESVLQQTLPDFELIISDNASTDGTAAICERYAALDSRVIVVKNSVNLGAHPNYRRVTQLARAPYFKWASANDLISRDYLERCVEVLDRRPEVVLAFGTTVLFEQDPAQGTPYDDAMNLQDDDAYARFCRCVEGLRLNNVFNGVIRLATLRKTSLLPNYLGADNLLLAELALAGKLVEVPGTHFYRRMSRESATRLQGTQELMKHLYADRRRSSLFQSWRLTRGYLNAVLFGGLPPGKLLRGLGKVSRHAYWRAPYLLQDVRDAFRTWVVPRHPPK